jgi:hypothetical protein
VNHPVCSARPLAAAIGGFYRMAVVERVEEAFG